MELLCRREGTEEFCCAGIEPMEIEREKRREGARDKESGSSGFG